jgi:Mrp family chromosome partitioning ATPase
VLIASVVDGVLLVIHSGKTSREVVRRSQKVLNEIGARIIGVILNGVNLTEHDYYYQGAYYKPASEARRQIAGPRGQ